MKKGNDIKSLEELFREEFRDYKSDPGSEFRARFERKLHYSEFMRFTPSRINIWYVAAAVTVATVITLLVLSGKHESSAVVQPSGGESVSEQFDVGVYEVRDSVTISPGSYRASEKVVSVDVESASVDNHVDSLVAYKNPERNKINKRSGTKASTVRSLKEESVAITVQAPLSRFITSNTSGCEPLTVSFENISHNYDSCVWDFGDGGFSSDDNPVWIFDEKGEFNVKLMVFGHDGRVSGSSEIITVYGNPVARFEIGVGESPVEGEVVRFYNYSENSVSWEWNFGDGENSSRFEPLHTFNKPGSYTISLVVTSQYGCSDSIAISNAFNDKSCYIRFPNVFIPNPGGPTGGYYSNRSDQNAEVFHPVWSGVTAYNLRIFSRLGILVFETSDIEIGWDGYIRGEKAEPGVYIWKVRGAFMNGEPFVKAGDVTIFPQ